MSTTDQELVLTHFIVSDDVERSRRFYTDVLGGTVARSGEPTNVQLANSWIVINRGGGPTDDKPTVTLETPRDLDRVSSFLNIRVKDIESVYAEWSARGARISDAAQAASVRDPLLHPRPGWLSDRAGADHRLGGGLDAASVAVTYARRGAGRTPRRGHTLRGLNVAVQEMRYLLRGARGRAVGLSVGWTPRLPSSRPVIPPLGPGAVQRLTREDRTPERT